MQQGLFDAPRARRRDPQTSHEAADRAGEFAERHYETIVNALKSSGPMGKSAIARVTGLDGVAVARRTTELQRAGRIALTGETVLSDSGRNERQWMANVSGQIRSERDSGSSNGTAG